MTLHDALTEIASSHNDKMAYRIYGGDALTFGNIERRSEAVASGLIAAGLLPGDRVCILSRHSLDALVLFWAVLRAGGVVVWLNDDGRKDDFPSVIGNASPAFIFHQNDKQRELLSGSPLEVCQVLSLDVIRSLEQSEIAARLPVVDPDSPATIIYTSGSSGRPKGVCLSHRNLLTVARSVQTHMPIQTGDSYLMVVPLHYVHGVMQLLVHSLIGASIYFCDSFVFPKLVTKAIVETRVSGFSGVPFHFNALQTRGGLLEQELVDLRWMTVTGGKLAESSIMTIIDRFPHIDFHIAYGQTECAPRATALAPEKIRSKINSVGAPIPDVDVLIVDESGQALPQGDTGEVVVAGNNVMLGYWRDEETTRQTLDELGRLHTGDLGRFDEEGDLFLVGRKSAMIKSAGERIAPEEIERVLEAHPQVAEACVTGKDDPMFGQVVVANIVAAAEANEVDDDSLIADVREHCLETLPPARSPREFIRWSEFPRKANGKADRQKISSGPPQSGK